MRKAAYLVAGWACLVTAGCGTPALDLAPERHDRPWRPSSTDTAPTPKGYVLPSNPMLGVLPQEPVFEPNRAYTLPELIDIAQSNHPDTRIAWANARNAALAVGVAQASYLPHLAATVVGGYQTSSGRSSALGVSLGSDGSASGAIGAVSLEWLLFDFGERRAVVEASQQASVVSNVAYTAAHQRLIHEICIAYYTNAAASGRVDAAQKSLRNAQEVEAAATSRHARGIGTVIEVAHARQATAQARLGLVQARGAAQDAAVTLLVAMGVSPLRELKLAELPRRALSRELMGPVEQIVSESLARRPDMLGAYAAQRASSAAVSAAEAELSPKLFLAATAAYNGGRLGVTAIPSVGQQTPTLNVSGNRWGGIVFLGLSVPIYDGSTRYSLLMQARSNAAKADAAFEQVRDTAIRQIIVARNALETSLSAYEAASELQSAAQTTYDAALDAYRHGVGSVTEAAGAETQLLVAQNASSDAYSHALSAAATLAFATGTLGSAPGAAGSQ